MSSPPPPSAVDSGASVFDSPARVGAGSSSPAVDGTAGVGALNVNAGWQMALPPGGGIIPRALRMAFRRGALTVFPGATGGVAVPVGSFAHEF